MAAAAIPASVYDVSVRSILGKETPIRDIIGGKVALIVNVASQCGFTGQYDGLEKLYSTYKDRGFVVVGCPCNQFGGQEPGTDEEIHKFACEKFKASFPMTAKMDVNGDKTHALWAVLKRDKPGFLGTEGIKWNFTKFLVDRSGRVVSRYSPTDKPEDIAKDIERLL